MNEFVQMSPQINELAAALSKAQGELHAVAKSGVNPAFKSSYAKLEDVIPVVRPVLFKHGLSIAQLPCGGNKDGAIIVTTVLMHSSGQWLSGSATYYAQKLGPQGTGSCITYARRYGILAVLNLESEDDDGNAATGHSTQQQQSNAPQSELGSFAPAPKASEGVYTVSFGKFKGKTLSEIPHEEIESYMRYLIVPRPGKDGKMQPIGDLAKEFIEQSRRFLQSGTKSSQVSPDRDEEPPFSDQDLPF